MMSLLDWAQGRYISSLRTRRSLPDPTDSEVEQELRQLIDNYNTDNISVDDLIESIMDDIYYSPAQSASNVNRNVHRLRHKGVFQGPLSITLESYILAQQARTREELAQNQESQASLISAWSQNGR